MKTFALITLTALAIIVAALPAIARAEDGCPTIRNLIDFNCDGRIKIVFTGDSIVKGVGDSRDPIEGYPGRLQRAWPWSEIENLGVPGITSTRLLRNFKKLLVKKPKGNTSRSVHEADLIVITVGVNDFYGGESPGTTVSNIVALIKYLRGKLKKDDGTAPLFLVGTLLNSTRGFQQPFISEVDALLLRYASASNLPAYLRFDTIDVYNGTVLNADGLHPMGSGYDEMSQLTSQTIKSLVQEFMAKQRTDKDHDGLYDQLEPKIGTNKKLADTDGDGLKDGFEYFTCATNPSKFDSDDDGNGDVCYPITPTPGPVNPDPTPAPEIPTPTPTPGF